MGMGFIFSSDTLGFLIIGTGILRKNLAEKWDRVPPPPPPSGPSDEKLLTNSVSESKKATKVYSEE